MAMSNKSGDTGDSWHGQVQELSAGRRMLWTGNEDFPFICCEDDLEQVEIPWHWQDKIEVGIVLQGSVEVSVEAERYTLSEGDGYFVNCDALNSCRQITDTPGKCSIRILIFDPAIIGGSDNNVFYDSYVDPIIKNNALKGLFLSKDEPWQKEIIRLAECCIEYCISSDEDIENKIRNTLPQMLFLLASHSTSDMRLISGKEAKDAERIRMMLSYIDEFYREDINVKILADSAEISESEVMRCFHNMLGTTPIQYVKNYRIRKAAELLKVSDDKIVDIAIECGFQDMSYFAKSFREAKGITPTDFRALYKKCDEAESQD
ncbi:AraC family transcriptional regulator [Oribacterium sp. WCC10]|uniref:AraC family transcriptional regulator n=1 Tax=Oribacterium sp. WCC10 TaxID=1855343 RepID=UPI0008F1A4DE|nr:AraC family transcriptional regulator [Oribacterium sp. WCC10]SFG31994.1 AraC-type DNA-binding protein [Oribacterium sp. WCC10]